MELSTISASALLSPAPLVWVGALLSLLLLYMVSRDKRLRSLPPGPKGLPLIGNVSAFSDPDNFYKTAVKWSREYGEIVHVKVGLSRFIFLNSPRVVKALMDKKGSIYSSRPYQPMVFDAYSNGKRYFFMPYGQLWRSVRRVSHAALNLSMSASYTPIQDFESKQTLFELLNTKSDGDFFDAARRYSASVIFTVTYGKRIIAHDDPIKLAVNEVVKHFIVMSEPGRWLVDSFPILTNLPGWMVQNWWKIGQDLHDADSAVYLGLYRDLVDTAKTGDAQDCFVNDFYQADPDKHGIDEETAAYTAGSLLEAGSQSTSDVFITLMLACLLFPDVVKQAQDELDRVIGKDRLPSFDDQSDLPYIRAMIKEVLRWKPILKLGPPHSTTEDDWFEDQFIPKGSTVILSWWAIQHDPDRWPNPDRYDPTRYLDDPFTSAESMNQPDPNARDHFTYGAGRRSCPGIHLAQNSLFILLSRTLWGFNITKSIGPDGKEIEPEVASEEGFQHAQIMRDAWLSAEKEGCKWSRKGKPLSL
ncbi:hypothetical protein ACJ41O_003487 [Fusarium nematophilum]